MRYLAQPRSRVEGRFGDGELVESLAGAFQHRPIETGAHAADIFQRLSEVRAHQERAEIVAAFSRLGPAANHHIQIVYDLEFQPRSGSLARIRAIAAFRDDAFQPSLFCDLE